MEYCPHYEGMDRVCYKCTQAIMNRQLTPFEEFINTRWDYQSSSAESAWQTHLNRKEKKSKARLRNKKNTNS